MHEFTVRSVQSLTPSVVLLTLDNKSEQPFSFTAGQYAALHFRRHGRPSPVRCFSIVSSPRQPDILQFAFRITGNYSYRMSQLKPGESVFVQGPFGEFCIDTDYDKSLVFLAGGIGITPFMSMLSFATQARLNLPITLVYACRGADDVPFAGYLATLAKQNPNLRILVVLGNGKLDDLPSTNAKVDGALLDTLNLPSKATYFVCGPPGFMDGLAATLTNAGVSESHLIMEAFGQRKVGSASTGGYKPKRLYALTAASIILGTGVLAGNNVWKSAHLSSVVHKLTEDDSSASANSDDNSENSSSSSGSTSTTTTNTAGSTQTNSAPTQTYQYQQPMSTVS